MGAVIFVTSRVRSMLVTDIDDKMCWRNFQDQLSFNIGVGYQVGVTNILNVVKIAILPPTSKNCRQF